MDNFSKKFNCISLDLLEAIDSPNIVQSLLNASHLLPNGISSYGQGWKSRQLEMNPIIIVSYCIRPNTKIQTNKTSNNIYDLPNQILNMNKRNLNGNEFDRM